MSWARRGYKPIPEVSSSRNEVEFNDYSKGINRYIANDVLAEKYLRYAQDARMPTLGEYETRKGTDFHSDAAGESSDQTITSTTGAADQGFNQVTRLAQKFTAGSSARLTKVELNLKNEDSATGTVMVEIWSDSSGEPGTKLATSSIDSPDIGSSYAYEVARFVSAPTLTSATAYWIVAYVQSNGSNSYEWSSTTSATTALSSDDSGASWASTSFALNIKTYMSTTAGVKGTFRAEKSDGTGVTLMAHATSLYKVDDATGALTAIKTGLSSSATNYRFVVVNDIVYYINGFDGLRKWDFTTESQVNSTNYTHIAVHKGLLFLCEKNDPNKVVFSNFADYETYTSTDFVYVPAPKTGDPVSAIYSLNGNLVLHTRFNKYILYGSDNATFLLEQAPGKKGTYTQETVAVDKNFAYFLSDDGLYAFNGTTDELLSESFYETIRDLPNKETSCLIIFKGRVRLFYAESGLAYNNACIVFNTTFDALESFDTGTYVARATVAFLDDRLIVGSSRVGQAYYQELDSNDYTNCGDVLQFDLQTHYMTFGSSAKFKEIRYWKPRFEAQSGDYEITCSYATDLRENSQTQSTPNTQGEGSVWGSSGTVWGSFTWGTTSELQGDLHVPGEYRRVQFRYSHTAARQPHKFLGHTFVVETRKLR